MAAAPDALPPVVLAIAGSDSGGGAGLQADVKAIHSNGGYAATAVTSVTAQNTRGVRALHHVPADIVRAQLDAVLEDLPVAAIKTGMLPTAAIVEVVAETIATSGVTDVVVDPIVIAGTGALLVEPDATAALRERLLPLARVITPNRDETAALTGMPIHEIDDLRRAAEALREACGVDAVVATGGHFDTDDSVDFVVTARESSRLQYPRLAGAHTHGTGCTFASALATRLACGDSIDAAAVAAKAHTLRAIRGGLALGSGNGPVDAR